MAGENILVVEDERIIARGIQKRLEGMGYAVPALAATGQEAVAAARARRPDLVLMDIQLADDMDGIEAAGRIRREFDVPVVYLTANSDPDTLSRAKRTEPHGYVLKPYEDRDLQTAVEMALYKHAMERRLRENEQWLAATLGSIGDGVIAVDEAGRVRFLNAVAEQLTGWPQADARGRDVREVFGVVDARTGGPVPNPALAALRAGRGVALAPGTRLAGRGAPGAPVDGTAAPIRDARGTAAGAVLVFRDVTERERLAEHLRQVEKMEAVGRLAGGIAHDFNNIMTVIAGFSDLLLTAAVPPAEAREYLREVKAAAGRAADLTRQVLAFGRRQVLVPCVLDLNAVVRDAGLAAGQMVGKGVEVVVDPDPAAGPVEVDPAHLTQAVLALVANARDAMPAGGRLTLRTRDTVLAPGAVRDRPHLAPGRYAVLAVADTGVGMSAAVRAHLFEPFFTTKEVGKGTGMGLASVYGLVRQSGGDIEVETAPGAGTTFRVYLPAAAEPPPTPPAAGPAAAHGTETILLVEDQPAVRRMTRLVLEQGGYAVLDAGTGEAALALAGQYTGPIHLLLTDLVMPGMSGREVAERAAAARPGLKVLFTSGYAEDIPAGPGPAGATEFLPKPFTASELAARVRDLLDR